MHKHGKRDLEQDKHDGNYWQFSNRCYKKNMIFSSFTFEEQEADSLGGFDFRPLEVQVILLTTSAVVLGLFKGLSR